MRRNSTQYVCLITVTAAVMLCNLNVPVEAKDRQLVLVYNTAPVTREVVIQAEMEASRIFREAVIDLQWLNCPTVL